MVNVARHARRILSATRDENGVAKAAFPTFISFQSAVRPSWWKPGLESETWGQVLGVYENVPGSSEGAVVIADNGIGLVENGAIDRWIPYAAIERWDKLTKNPVAKSIRVWTKSGQATEFPFEHGGAFAFVQFLISAIREHRRENE